MKYFGNPLEHIWVTALTVTLFYILAWITFNIDFLSPVARGVENFSLSDYYYGVDWDTDKPAEISEDIVLVDLKELKDRSEIAKVFTDVQSCHPAVIGVDIIFEKYKDEYSDSVLRTVVDTMQNTVFAYQLLDYDDETSLYGNRFVSYFSPSEENSGYVNAWGNVSNTCLRRFSMVYKYQGAEVPSFISQVVSKFVGGSNAVRQEGGFLINYRHIDFNAVPYDSVDVNAELLRDKIVLISALDEEKDMHYTPLGKMPGCKVQAYAIQTLLEQREISTASVFSQSIIALILCYITVLWQFYWARYIGRKDHPVYVFLSNSVLSYNLMTLAWLAFIVFGTYLLYEIESWYLPMVLPIALVLLVVEARGIYMALMLGLMRTKLSDKVKDSIYIFKKEKK